MANELKVGDRRHGALFDENDGTPNVSATLERTDGGIYVSIHWDSEKSPEFGRWFTNDGFFSDVSGQGPDQDKPDPEVPSELIFTDSYGSVSLVGCRSAGYHTNFFIGTGRIRVGAAIIGAASISYSSLNGLRSEISGLRSWLGTTSIHQRHRFDPVSGSRQKTIVELVVPESIKVPGTGIVLRPNYSRITKSDSLEIRDKVHVEHQTEDPSAWTTHLNAQRAIRDILAISRWRDESLIPRQAMRKDDPLQLLGGSTAQERWLGVLDNTSASPKQESNSIGHFIEFDELGPEGISRWITLRENFARAIDPVSAGRKLSHFAGRKLGHVDESYSAVFSGLVEGRDSI